MSKLLRPIAKTITRRAALRSALGVARIFTAGLTSAQRAEIEAGIRNQHKLVTNIERFRTR
ncbi:MAG: hypothetical protein HY344_01480 [Candidatus Levybacteria bacterium]|nr:hypothetical protein [Candidatus Levybacteria bacterium]